ncbi:MAG: peptide deformylase [Planctomycetia bacterium]|nr:peptide deformylase [Planctomycetia bacterium]
MSNTRKSTKAAASTSTERSDGGTTRSVSGRAAASSNTTAPGSLPRPSRAAARVQIGIPSAQTSATRAASKRSVVPPAPAASVNRVASHVAAPPVASDSGIPTSAPNVPGARGAYPTPPQVPASSHGSRARRTESCPGSMTPSVAAAGLGSARRFERVPHRSAAAVEGPSSVRLSCSESRAVETRCCVPVVPAGSPSPTPRNANMETTSPAAEIGPLALVEYPHPALARRAKPVMRLDDSLAAAIDRMFEIMYEAGGIGLAANQVALPYRLFVVNCSGHPDEGEELVFVNPVLSKPRGTAVQEEGCLSLPGVRMDVRRPARVVVDAWSLDGEPIHLDLEGLLARVVQHEYDHLDGRLFTDRLPEAATLEVRRSLETFREVFAGKQARGELPPTEVLLAELDRLEAARCTA